MSKSYVGMLVCANCGADVGVLLDRRLRDTFEYGENYADGTLCDDCAENQRAQSIAVEAGGVYFRCSECSVEGVVQYAGKGARAFCEAIRTAHFGQDDPEWRTKACGVEFTPCTQHVDMGIERRA